MEREKGQGTSDYEIAFFSKGLRVLHYKDLTVWQKSMDLTTEIYRLTQKLPKEELYGLTNQLRRAAVSIPSNIAEGNARFSTKEYMRFLSIARGSVAEIETQILICVRLNYLEQKDIETALSLINENERMLNSMITKLRARDKETNGQ